MKRLLPLAGLAVAAALAVGVAAAVGSGSGQAAGEAKSAAPVVINVNNHVVGFYTGRDLTGPSPMAKVKGNWVDVDWSLGEINYAIYKGDQAIVYDTMITSPLGKWVRDYLTKKKGIKHFTVVLSHWHLDHIAGNNHYKDSPIVALDQTRATMEANAKAIRKGTFWGPPGLDLVLPDITFTDRLDLHLGDLKVEFHHFNIHSKDANLAYIPKDKLLLAGDALEDTVTYMGEPADIPTHIVEMKRLKRMAINRIFPQHGDPAVLKRGGYTEAFIDAVTEYDRNMLRYLRKPDYLSMPIEDFMPKSLARGTVSIWEPYVAIHEQNLKLLRNYYEHRPLPKIP